MKFTDIINEDENKIKNKVKNVYRALKIGTITVQRGGPCKVKYVLPDEYYVSVSGDGVLNIVLTMNPQQKMKMYYVHKNHETGEMIEKYIDGSIRTHLYQWMKDNIENKFKQFQINFIF